MVALVDYAMDLLVMMLMVSSLADSILVRQELLEELAY